MSTEFLIPLDQLSRHYEVEISFIGELHDFGLIEITTVDQVSFLHPDHLAQLEKAIRLQHDLGLNMEGVDVVVHLLRRIEELQQELQAARAQLRMYQV
ncbi:MAG: hypothetical protein RLZZ165_1125 [Bacteroidota bacterium]